MERAHIFFFGSTVVSNVPRPSSSGTIAGNGNQATATTPTATTPNATTNTGTGYVSNNTSNELTCDPRYVPYQDIGFYE